MINNNSKSSNLFSSSESPAPIRDPQATASLWFARVKFARSPGSDCSEGWWGRHQICISLCAEIQVYALLGEIDVSSKGNIHIE